MEADCSKLLPFMAGELVEKEDESFVKHLMKCKSCSKEFEEMKGAWNALQFDFEEKEVPNSLKKEVMDYVFMTEQNRNIVSKPNSWVTLLKKQFSPLASGLLLILTAITLFLSLYIVSLQSVLKREHKEISVPTEVLDILTVQAADVKNNQLSGRAAVIQEGTTEKLIVQVEHLPQLKNSEVYQVWLLNDGGRENAGMFKPNENGTGMLSFQLKKDSQFDQIGITIEPDETSLQPRGKKIAGTG